MLNGPSAGRDEHTVAAWQRAGKLVDQRLQERTHHRPTPWTWAPTWGWTDAQSTGSDIQGPAIY